MGYDPIFKSQPGPPAIQPAPTTAPSMQPASATSSPYPPPPQGYMTAAAAQPYAPTLSTSASSPASSAEPFDYGTAIDPALEGAMTAQVPIPASSFDSGGDYKHGLENVNAFPLSAPPQQNHKGDDPSFGDDLSHEWRLCGLVIPADPAWNIF